MKKIISSKRLIPFLLCFVYSSISLGQMNVRVLTSDSAVHKFSDPKKVSVRPMLRSIIKPGGIANPKMKIKEKSSGNEKIFKASKLLMIYIEEKKTGKLTLSKQLIIQGIGIKAHNLPSVMLCNDTATVYELTSEGANNQVQVTYHYYLNDKRVKMSKTERLDWIKTHFGNCDAIKQYLTDPKTLKKNWDNLNQAFLKNCYTVPF